LRTELVCDIVSRALAGSSTGGGSGGGGGAFGERLCLKTDATATVLVGARGPRRRVSAIDRILSFEVTYFLPNGSRNPCIIEFQCTIDTVAFAFFSLLRVFECNFSQISDQSHGAYHDQDEYPV
jgi:hypothetical protein